MTAAVPCLLSWDVEDTDRPVVKSVATLGLTTACKDAIPADNVSFLSVDRDAPPWLVMCMSRKQHQRRGSDSAGSWNRVIEDRAGAEASAIMCVTV